LDEKHEQKIQRPLRVASSTLPVHQKARRWSQGQFKKRVKGARTALSACAATYLGKTARTWLSALLLESALRWSMDRGCALVIGPHQVITFASRLNQRRQLS